MHSQRLNDTPTATWIISHVDILSAHCNCMAGLGEACSHIGAILFYIDATVQIRDSKTVTQEKAYWMLPSACKGVPYSEPQKCEIYGMWFLYINTAPIYWSFS